MLVSEKIFPQLENMFDFGCKINKECGWIKSESQELETRVLTHTFDISSKL